MDNTIDPVKLRKAKTASSCFMGLGQILYLKQYVRGALYALVEIVMICAVVFGSIAIVPKNKSADSYMRGIPDTTESVEYLMESENPKVVAKVEKITASRSKSMEAFVKKYNADLVADIDFSDVEAISEAIEENFEENEAVLDKYYKLYDKYDKTLAKMMAKEADKQYRAAKGEEENAFDSNYDGCSLCKRAHKAGIRSTKHTAFFRGPLVKSIAGLITLGSVQDTNLAKYKDHSVFMMINGIMALIVVGFFVVLYLMNINSAAKSAEKIIKNGKFPTLEEARGDISQNSFATIGIAPAIVLIAVFSIIPLLFSALVAFTNYASPDHIPPNNLVDWVGLENFVTMFSSRVGGASNAWASAFARTAIWTIIWAIFATFSCFFVGFFYAVILQDKRIVIPKFYRTIYILPYAIPTMLSLFIWANLLNGTIGPINKTLQILGLVEKPIGWLSNPTMAKISLIFVNIWIGFPYSMILTTSSMTAISNSLYEAATIDGANKWQQFMSITYPLVMFQLKPTLIMQFAGNINNFGAVFFLSGGGPNMQVNGVNLTTSTQCGATDLLISWIYKLTMNTPSKYNLASVLSLLVFAVLVPFALYNYTRTKSFKEGEI